MALSIILIPITIRHFPVSLILMVLPVFPFIPRLWAESNLKRLMVIGATAFAYMGLSLFWTPHFNESCEKIIKAAFIVFPFLLLISFHVYHARNITQFPVFRVPITYMILGTGFLIGFIGVTVDILSHGALYNLIHGNKLSDVIIFSIFNKAVTLLVLSGFLIVAAGPFSKYFKFLSFLGLATLAFLANEAQTAQLSIIVMLTFWYSWPFLQRFTKPIIFFGFMGFILFAPLVLYFAYGIFADFIHYQGKENIFGRASVLERLEIWHFVSIQIFESPLWGHGFYATRFTDFNASTQFYHKDTIYHAHNTPLQLWFELGLIGILPLIYGLYRFYRWNCCLDNQRQRIVTVFLSGLMIPLLCSWGAWQGWWLSAICFLWVLLLTLLQSNLLRNESR